MKMLITGGTGSLGEELVKEFYKDYDVTFTYYSNIEKAKEMEEKYNAHPEVELCGFNASKSALETLTKTIAKEYGEFGITANSVLPSTFESKTMQDVLKEYVHNEQEKKEYYDMLVADSPIKRLVTTREIAKLVRYLVSDDASFINGASIPIDGGYSL